MAERTSGWMPEELSLANPRIAGAWGMLTPRFYLRIGDASLGRMRDALPNVGAPTYPRSHGAHRSEDGLRERSRQHVDRQRDDELPVVRAHLLGVHPDAVRAGHRHHRRRLHA